MTPLRPTAFALLLLLTGCAGAPGIPDTVYFRLPPRAEAPQVPAALPQPIVVETLLADGLHSDQAIIYSTVPDGAVLKAYHYQLWVDPPVRMLQRRLIATLRAAGSAAIVADRLPNQVEALRVQGRLERFERLRTPDGWRVAVALSLRVDRRDNGTPILLREYAEEVDAGGDKLSHSVSALGAAVDRLFARFVADLHAAASDG